MSTYLISPFYFCTYNSCSIVQNNGSACSYVTFNSLGSNLFDLILDTSIVELTQSCKINCILPNGVDTINTKLFTVKIDYKCTLSSSYIET